MSGAPLHTRIWHEEPEADNPFATRVARCHGYDVYGQMLGRASWADIVWLLIKGEAPSTSEAAMLNALAVALANPGPRDPMVHAAMCGGVGGSQAAASLMAALAVGAGQSGGARDVYLSMRLWAQCDKQTPSDWIGTLSSASQPTWLAPDDAGWPAIEHPAGFDANGVSTPTIVRQSLDTLAPLSRGPRLAWMATHREALERASRLPLAMTGVAAAALADMGFNARQGEMLFLLLRLPGAAAHALEQADYGFKHFPYPDVDLLDDPLNKHQETAA
ncbi:MAG TPA: citryl-CoA lyase [Aquabacterium sp.]|uniref:citryl-CoA lyase n=1 Tax=Aquabacterium sp. TaxID=1872578 RepID=UPI002E3497F8|nr:citryl-CoA lyase [Aquabacterium sp.]HEX5355869.1 citryl-CoA lyase [Aquabacterium sp.]